MPIMTGNLSHQVEHHLFPDLPSNRYAETAPRVEDLFRRYDLRYRSASLPRQVGSAWRKVIRLSLPNNWLAQTTCTTATPPGTCPAGSLRSSSGRSGGGAGCGVPGPGRDDLDEASADQVAVHPVSASTADAVAAGRSRSGAR